MCGDNRSLQARDLGFHWDGDRLARKTEVACLMDGELVYYGSRPQSNREVVLVVLVVLTRGNTILSDQPFFFPNLGHPCG